MKDFSLISVSPCVRTSDKPISSSYVNTWDVLVDNSDSKLSIFVRIVLLCSKDFSRFHLRFNVAKDGVSVEDEEQRVEAVFFREKEIPIGVVVETVLPTSPFQFKGDGIYEVCCQVYGADDFENKIPPMDTIKARFMLSLKREAE